MKTKDIKEEISFRFFVIRMRFTRRIKNVPWRLRLWMIDLSVEILNIFFPYCDICMNTRNYWVKCKPYVGSPHSDDWRRWIGKKDCYMKGFKKS